MTVSYSCQIYLYCASLVLLKWLNGPLYLLNEWESDEPCE